MWGKPYVDTAIEQRKVIKQVYETGEPTDAEIDAALKALKQRAASGAVAAKMAGLTTSNAGGPDDLTQHVIGKILDKYDKSLDSCPAPQQSQVQHQSVLPPDGEQAVGYISSGGLSQMLATQVICGTGSNPLPADVGSPPLQGCTSGTFVCGSGKLICRDKVCNRSNDCGDNSDEGSNMCQPQSCCQVTNGCPGETGSSCAGSCCCCPYGQACDRVNPGRGCVPSD